MKLWQRFRRIGTDVVDFPRNLMWFFRNLRRYRKSLWRFRTWDWACNYTLFVETLKDTRDHLAKHQNHTEWQRDVRQIDTLLAWWNQYNNAIEDWPEKLTLDQLTAIEENAWREFHRELQRHGRGWWD